MPKEIVFFPWYQSHSWKPKTRNERCGQPLRIALPPGILPLSAISAEVFILLGLGVFLMRRAYSWPLIGWTLLACLAGRALNLGVSQDSDETRESRPFLLWCRHFKRLKRRLGVAAEFWVESRNVYPLALLTNKLSSGPIMSVKDCLAALLRLGNWQRCNKWLVDGLEHYIFFHIFGRIIPTG